MEINKLREKFEKRIKHYEETRDNRLSMPEELYQLYGTIICELRFMFCEVCEWYADGILGKENKNETEGSSK